MRQIQIFDTTLRDGEQSPGCSMNGKEKIDMARQLESLGVDIIEAGFAIGVAGGFQRGARGRKGAAKTRVTSLSRALSKDIDSTWEALRHAKYPRIHLFIADLRHRIMEYKLKKIARRGAGADCSRWCDYAKALRGHRVFRRGRNPKRSRVSRESLVKPRWKRARPCINMPDSVGYATPEEYGNLFRFLREPVKGAEHVTVFHALPQRPGAGGRQLACRDSGGRNGRWNARSTASASARATPRWKRS